MQFFLMYVKNTLRSKTYPYNVLHRPIQIFTQQIVYHSCGQKVRKRFIHLETKVPNYNFNLLEVLSPQQTQNICIALVQCWTNVEDVGPTNLLMGNILFFLLLTSVISNDNKR